MRVKVRHQESLPKVLCFIEGEIVDVLINYLCLSINDKYV